MGEPARLTLDTVGSRPTSVHCSAAASRTPTRRCQTAASTCRCRCAPKPANAGAPTVPPYPFASSRFDRSRCVTSGFEVGTVKSSCRPIQRWRTRRSRVDGSMPSRGARCSPSKESSRLRRGSTRNCRRPQSTRRRRAGGAGRRVHAGVNGRGQRRRAGLGARIVAGINAARQLPAPSGCNSSRRS